MSRNTKIILVIVGSLFSMCCLLGIAAIIVLPRLASTAFNQDPRQAKQVAAQIADYVLPSDYEERFSMDVFTTKMVLIDRADNRGLSIMLMQIAAAGASREQMEAQMRQSFQQQFQRNSGELKPVGTETVTIKGQPVTLTISEGTLASDNIPVRQAIGVFNGKGGTAMLMVYGPQAEWDKALLTNFYQSIR